MVTCPNNEYSTPGTGRVGDCFHLQSQMVQVAPGHQEQKTECRKMVLPGTGAVGVTRLSSFSFVFCPFVPEDILFCDRTLGQIPVMLR